jgi:hypothetical protein
MLGRTCARGYWRPPRWRRAAASRAEDPCHRACTRRARIARIIRRSAALPCNVSTPCIHVASGRRLAVRFVGQLCAVQQPVWVVLRQSSLRSRWPKAVAHAAQGARVRGYGKPRRHVQPEAHHRSASRCGGTMSTPSTARGRVFYRCSRTLPRLALSGWRDVDVRQPWSAQIAAPHFQGDPSAALRCVEVGETGTVEQTAS